MFLDVAMFVGAIIVLLPALVVIVVAVRLSSKLTQEEESED
jgi:hypothetical protein